MQQFTTKRRCKFAEINLVCIEQCESCGLAVEHSAHDSGFDPRPFQC